MVSIIKGISKKFVSSENLYDFFRVNHKLNGVFYIGYPILFSTIESITIDALWISEEYGIIVFDLVENGIINIDKRLDLHDDLNIRLSNLLTQYSELRKRTTLLVPINVITYAPDSPKIQNSELSIVNNNDELLNYISALQSWDSKELFEKSLSVIQSVTKLKDSNKRNYVKKSDSRGSKLKKLEETIASLDNYQEKAIVEYFGGIQRIRGLAGSGKTIILALKAAYLYSQYPDWKIAVTFNTRSLKKQFKDLIERFVVEKKGELPNWDNLQIIHAWGNSTIEGIYYNICKDYGIEYLDFKSSNIYKYKIGEKDMQSFEAVCKKALEEISISAYKPKYDLILVDEAQDLSENFLQLCYNISSHDKRLIYAYDELQKLYEGSSLKNPKDIFGIEEFDDRMLRVCYRNSKPVLATAHALGFGVYRDKPETQRLVQFFDNPKLWEDVGYEVKEGNMVAGEIVKLARTEMSSPPYLERNLSINNDDIIQFHSFKDKSEQAKFIATTIKNDIANDELLTKDIIVINPEALTTKSEVGIIRVALQKLGYNSHIAGVSDADVFFQDNSITFTGINRAKGNEVPMVYIMNADYCFQGLELKKKRNILFTAITRSKAWVRVCGIGPDMDGLIEEFKKVRDNKFTLKFKYPSDEQIKKMNLINRDMSEDEKEEIKVVANSIKDVLKFLDRIKQGKASIDDFPDDVQSILEQLLDKI